MASQKEIARPGRNPYSNNTYMHPKVRVTPHTGHYETILLNILNNTLGCRHLIFPTLTNKTLTTANTNSFSCINMTYCNIFQSALFPVAAIYYSVKHESANHLLISINFHQSQSLYIRLALFLL